MGRPPKAKRLIDRGEQDVVDEVERVALAFAEEALAALRPRHRLEAAPLACPLTTATRALWRYAVKGEGHEKLDTYEGLLHEQSRRWSPGLHTRLLGAVRARNDLTHKEVVQATDLAPLLGITVAYLRSQHGVLITSRKALQLAREAKVAGLPAAERPEEASNVA